MIKFYEMFNSKFIHPRQFAKTEMSVMAADTLMAAEIFKYQNPCCLNFASHKRPGGGYRNYLKTYAPINVQEEDLFRRSNLPQLMDIPDVHRYYPLMGAKGLFTDGITVDKDEFLKPIDPFNISLITVAAVVNPKSHKDFETTKNKIRLILHIAAANKATHLILGAWGCGIFGNDPKIISKGFKNLIQNDFDGVFEKVVFAIPGIGSKNYVMFDSVINKD